MELGLAVRRAFSWTISHVSGKALYENQVTPDKTDCRDNGKRL